MPKYFLALVALLLFSLPGLSEAGAGGIEVAPFESFPAGWESYRSPAGEAGEILGAERLATLVPLVAVQGGSGPATSLGERRIRWSEGRFELAFLPSGVEGRARVLGFDGASSSWQVLASIPSPGGGEPRIYLSDRDPLVAFTVDFQSWDTCPEIRWLRPEGSEPVPLPCPQAGIAAMRALRERGPKDRSASLGQLQLRLRNLRWVKPSFLLEGGVDLEAELRWKVDGGVETYPAELRLEGGKISRCQVSAP